MNIPGLESFTRGGLRRVWTHSGDGGKRIYALEKAYLVVAPGLQTVIERGVGGNQYKVLWSVVWGEPWPGLLSRAIFAGEAAWFTSVFPGVGRGCRPVRRKVGETGQGARPCPSRPLILLPLWVEGVTVGGPPWLSAARASEPPFPRGQAGTFAFCF